MGVSIGLIEGGGTGPELVEAARRCLAVLEDAGVPIEVLRFDDAAWREPMAEELYDRGLHEELVDFYERVRARGGAVVRGSLPAPILYRMRRELELAAHVVPLNPFPELSSFPQFRVLLVRESNQGLYHFERMVRKEHGVSLSAEWRLDTLRYLAARAFELARGDGSMRVTTVLKTSVLGDLGELWLEVFADEARRNSDVQYAHRPSGAGFSDMWLEPERYGVVVASDEAGDILADLVPSVLYGSRNITPTANFSPRGYASYQTDHGTIKPLEGKDLANPLALLGALGLALRHTCASPRAADALEAAIRASLAEGLRTYDLWRGAAHKRVGTRALTERVCAHLERGLAEGT